MLGEQQRRDEKPGQHEEGVDAEEAAVQDGNPAMEGEDRGHGQAADAVQRGVMRESRTHDAGFPARLPLCLRNCRSEARDGRQDNDTTCRWSAAPVECLDRACLPERVGTPQRWRVTVGNGGRESLDLSDIGSSGWLSMISGSAPSRWIVMRPGTGQRVLQPYGSVS
jgi:hypothetical protein